MTEGRRRDGERPPVGAWDTPAVVVRAPDGSIVDHKAGRTNGRPPRRSVPGRGQAGDSAGTDGQGEAGAEAGGAGAPRRTRVRPRRIPGAPGAVLAVPTLRPEAADGRE